jgi:hypothetical protein
LPVPPPPDTAAAPTRADALARQGDVLYHIAATLQGQPIHSAVCGVLGELRRTVEWLRAPAPATDDAPTARENDIRRVADFIVGWWPGLEDGLCWGDDDALDNHPVRLAARRLLGRGPSAPAGPPQEASHE